MFNTIAAVFKDSPRYNEKALGHVKQWISPCSVSSLTSRHGRQRAPTGHGVASARRREEGVGDEQAVLSGKLRRRCHRPRDDVVSLASNMDAMSVTCMSEAADNEVADILRGPTPRSARPSATARTRRRPPRRTVSVTRRWKDKNGKGQAEASISSPEALQFADPDLLCCETTSQLLMLQSILMKMPKDHKERKLVEALVDQMEKAWCASLALAPMAAAMAMSRR